MEFKELLNLMDVLLGENGCPWDREQTHESLRPHMLEESYEAVDAINNGDMTALCEELGDVLLQVVFHAKLAEKAGAFNIGDVIRVISEKLVSRHTHVFGTDSAADGDEVIKIWDANKEKEKAGSVIDDMNAVAKALPALIRASKVIKRSKTALPPVDDIIIHINDKLNNNIILSEDFGGILLAFTALGNILGINAEFSLTNAVEAFINDSSTLFPPRAV